MTKTDAALVARERRLREQQAKLKAKLDAVTRERQAVVRELVARHSVRDVGAWLGLHWTTVQKMAARTGRRA